VTIEENFIPEAEDGGTVLSPRNRGAGFDSGRILIFFKEPESDSSFFEKPDPVQGSLFIFGCSSNLRCLYKPVQIFDPIRFISEKTLIKHFTAVINTVWISISDPVECFSKSSPIRIRFWIARDPEPDHVQHWCAWTGFGIFWIWTPAASNRIRCEIF